MGKSKDVFFEDPQEEPFPGIDRKVSILRKKLKILQLKVKDVGDEIYNIQNKCEVHGHRFYFRGVCLSGGEMVNQYVCVCGQVK